jgi:predicted dehydrogenase
MVRIAVMGAGNMGSFYAAKLAEGAVPGAVLAAVCDVDPGRLARWAPVPGFTGAADLFAAGGIDAVVVATPHYDHTTLGIAALQAGLHVLVDKPISVHKADALALLAAHTDPTRVFAAMLNQRTDPYFLKIKELMTDGSLGTLRRVQWTITNWFRTGAYYASGGWRATWAGEGGGVLLNQCPHQLDLLCWLCGMPERVTARAAFGKYHAIEVEDEVTALLEYPGGATGVFIASTGEAPGTNRLELTGENGKLVLEDDRLVFHRNAEAMTEFSRRTTESFAAPPVTVEVLEGLGHGPQHLGVLENFVAAIRGGAPLIAPASEGLASVELANAMLLAAFTGEAVALPLDAVGYAGALAGRVQTSRFVKPAAGPGSGPVDMKGSF